MNVRPLFVMQRRSLGRNGLATQSEARKKSSLFLCMGFPSSCPASLADAPEINAYTPAGRKSKKTPFVDVTPDP